MFLEIDGGIPIRTLAEHYRTDSAFKGSLTTAANSIRSGSATRYDSDEGNIYFMRELEALDKRMFDVKYAELPYLKHVPIIPGPTPYDEYYTYRAWDTRGRAQWGMPDSTTSIAKSNVNVLPEQTYLLRSMVAGFGYGIREIAAAAQAGRPLEQMRATAARRGISELQNKTTLFGETEFGMLGLFNQSGIQTYTPSVDGSALSSWINSAKTSQQILNDLTGLVQQVFITSKNVFQINKILMPLAQYEFLRIQPYVPGAGFSSTKTILQQFESLYPSILVDSCLGLETAGTGGTTRMIGYNQSEEYVGVLLPVLFEMFAPFNTGTGFDVLCHARMGEVITRYPQTMIYEDGI
jgi:hypothetical protein